MNTDKATESQQSGPAVGGPGCNDQLGLAPPKRAPATSGYVQVIGMPQPPTKLNWDDETAQRPPMDGLSAQALAQMDKARDFPANTCGASRHLALLAEAILRDQPCPQWTEDPKHCAESMAWAVAALWYARTELANLREAVATLTPREKA